LFNEQDKLSIAVEQQLAACGYWSLGIETAFGGEPISWRDFYALLTRVASLEPSVAGVLAVHRCLGPAGHLQRSGTLEQQQTWLPQLARGGSLGIFALTERGAGTDLTALQSRAEREGDGWLLSGEKLLLTNAGPGRTVAWVGRVEDRVGLFLFTLPHVEDATFQWVDYPLHALRHTPNRGFRLTRFRVPGEARLLPRQGDGLTLAYQGLNRGRVAVCAIAAGTLRGVLAGLLPWVRFRRTYGEPIAQRELVSARLARLAALIVGADALSAWGGSLLDQQERGELEGIIAKTFAGDALREGALEIALKTHGGRTFLRGHRVGDALHDFLAPGIYEGEGDILGLAFFRALTKQHAYTLFEPLQKCAERLAVKRLKLWNPYHVWHSREGLTSLARWRWQQVLRSWHTQRFTTPQPFLPHVQAAQRGLQTTALEISQYMLRYGRRLAQLQCRMLELARRVQQYITLAVVAEYGARQEREVVRLAADCLCKQLRCTLAGGRPSDADLRTAQLLGRRVAAGEFPLLEAASTPEFMFPYEHP
jgi:alkylation response protein AidB-like acyl-CoA dehydrogenase